MNKLAAIIISVFTFVVSASALEKKKAEKPPHGIHWITPMNTEISEMAFGIGPTPTKTEAEAANWAKLAKKSTFDDNKTLSFKPKWKEIQFFVFPRSAEAKTFYDYQVLRRSQSLQQADFLKLTSVWKGTSVCVVFDEVKRKQRIFYPQRNPKNWWKPLFVVQKPAPETRYPKP